MTPLELANFEPGGTVLDGMTFTDDGKNVRPFILGDTVVGNAMSGGPEASCTPDGFRTTCLESNTFPWFCYYFPIVRPFS